MDDPQGAILLFDTEPGRPVGGIRVLVDPCSEFIAEDLNYLI